MTKAIILTAGYAVRLYPLTENFPKPLLKIAGKPLIEYIIEKINEIKEVNEIIIVSNHKFIDHFYSWNKNFKNPIPIKIIDDGSTTNENRLGAIKDSLFAIEKENINEDILIIAGDNLIEFSLNDFYKNFKKLNKNLIAVYDIKDIEKVRKKHGVAILDKNNKVIGFQEKPENPLSTIKSICCYIFKPEIKNLIKEYIKNNNPDATGFFIEWLINHTEVYAHIFKEPVYDIGNMESYLNANRIFSEK
jgi:glucose-1-phosphate thymidylyltransferase